MFAEEAETHLLVWDAADHGHGPRRGDPAWSQGARRWSDRERRRDRDDGEKGGEPEHGGDSSRRRKLKKAAGCCQFGLEFHF